MATNLVGKTPLALRVEPLRKDHLDLVKKFHQVHGSDHVATLLAEAGITDGECLFRVCDTYKSRGRPAPIQVRRFDETGVHIWMNHGDNESGVKGVLVVTKDKTIAPEDLYKKLRAVVAADELFRGDPGPGLPRSIDPPQDLVVLVLTAANEMVASHWPTHDAFISAMLPKVGCESAADLIELLETLVDRGLMSSHRTSYAVSRDGQALLDALPPPPEPQPEPETPTVATQAPAAPTPAAKTDDNDIVALVAANKAKLERLLKLPELVAECRKRKKDLQGQIEKLMEDLKKEALKEQQLLDGFDPDALRLLIEEPRR